MNENLFKTDFFDEFWEEHPKKIGKKYTRQCFRRINPGKVLFNKMMVALKKQKTSEEWKSRKYIPNPSTWLNGEKWEDELTYKETTSEQHARLKAKGKI